MIDHKKCYKCSHYTGDGYCDRFTFKDKPSIEQFDTNDGITVIVCDEGYLIPLTDITRCDLNEVQM